MTWDTAYHAGEYLRHFRAATKRAGIDIVGERRFSQLITQQAVDGAQPRSHICGSPTPMLSCTSGPASAATTSLKPYCARAGRSRAS